MKLKNNKGVTLVSLSVYIIVSVIVLASLTFLNINFMSQVADLSTESEITNEIMKAESALISDIKAASKVLDYSEILLTLDTGVKYTVKYSSNTKDSTHQTYNTYELYRNNVLITDKLSKMEFDYDDINKEWVSIKILDSDMSGGEIFLKIGKGY